MTSLQAGTPEQATATAEAADAQLLAVRALDTGSTGGPWRAARALPDLGDMGLAVPALLSLPNADVTAVLDKCAQQQPATSFAQSRRLALIGMFVSCLRATSLAVPDHPDLSVQAQAAHERLLSSPWQLWQQCDALEGSGSLTHAAAAARQQAALYCQKLQAASSVRLQQLLAASDVRRMRAVLPHLTEHDCSALAPEADPLQREELFMQVNTHCMALDRAHSSITPASKALACC